MNRLSASNWPWLKWIIWLMVIRIMSCWPEVGVVYVCGGRWWRGILQMATDRPPDMEFQ